MRVMSVIQLRCVLEEVLNVLMIEKGKISRAQTSNYIPSGSRGMAQVWSKMASPTLGVEVGSYGIMVSPAPWVVVVGTISTGIMVSPFALSVSSGTSRVVFGPMVASGLIV